MQLPTPIYLDTDLGIDDTLALAYLLASDTADVVGIGAVHGNTTVEIARRNILDVLSLANAPEIPVATGAASPLVGEFHGGAAHVHGKNGIGDVEIPRSHREVVDFSAAQLIIDLSHRHSGALHLVAIGPLTNVALALSLDPSLPARVRGITVMGGTARVPGNITPVAEANIYHDPEAAAIVLAADWDLTLVPLDVTMEQRLTEDDRHALAASPEPLARAIDAMLDVYADWYFPIFGVREIALHDPLAAAVADGSIRPRNAPLVAIQVDRGYGPGRGQTICDLRGRFIDHMPNSSRTRVVLETETAFAPLLLGSILAPRKRRDPQ